MNPHRIRNWNTASMLNLFLFLFFKSSKHLLSSCTPTVCDNDAWGVLDSVWLAHQETKYNEESEKYSQGIRGDWLYIGNLHIDQIELFFFWSWYWEMLCDCSALLLYVCNFSVWQGFSIWRIKLWDWIHRTLGLGNKGLSLLLSLYVQPICFFCGF